MQNQSEPYARQRLYYCFMFVLNLISGEVGNASKMNLVLQLMAGVTLAGLAEGMALADRAGLQQKDVLEVMELTSLACPTILDKGRGLSITNFPWPLWTALHILVFSLFLVGFRSFTSYHTLIFCDHSPRLHCLLIFSSNLNS